MSVRLNVGDAVLVRTTSTQQRIGLIKYIGPMIDVLTQYVGIELVDKIENGHDGTINSFQYFSAIKGYGFHCKITDVIRKLLASELVTQLRDVTALFHTKIKYIDQLESALSEHKWGNHTLPPKTVPFGYQTSADTEYQMNPTRRSLSSILHRSDTQALLSIGGGGSGRGTTPKFNRKRSRSYYKSNTKLNASDLEKINENVQSSASRSLITLTNTSNQNLNDVDTPKSFNDTPVGMNSNFTMTEDNEFFPETMTDHEFSYSASQQSFIPFPNNKMMKKKHKRANTLHLPDSSIDSERYLTDSINTDDDDDDDESEYSSSDSQETDHEFSLSKPISKQHTLSIEHTTLQPRQRQMKAMTPMTFGYNEEMKVNQHHHHVVHHMGNFPQPPPKQPIPYPNTEPLTHSKVRQKLLMQKQQIDSPYPKTESARSPKIRPTKPLPPPPPSNAPMNAFRKAKTYTNNIDGTHHLYCRREQSIPALSNSQSNPYPSTFEAFKQMKKDNESLLNSAWQSIEKAQNSAKNTKSLLSKKNIISKRIKKTSKKKRKFSKAKKKEKSMKKLKLKKFMKKEDELPSLASIAMNEYGAMKEKSNKKKKNKRSKTMRRPFNDSDQSNATRQKLQNTVSEPVPFRMRGPSLSLSQSQTDIVNGPQQYVNQRKNAVYVTNVVVV